MASETIEKADVCVIGAGPGGGVVAKELAEAGAKVVILERGGEFGKLQPGETITDGGLRTFTEKGAFRFSLTAGLPAMPIIYGFCVGGSAALNAGTSWRIPQTILESWRGKYGLDYLEDAYVEKLYKSVETFVNIHEIEPETMGGNGEVFKRGIDALGYSGGPTRRNTRGCIGLGHCVAGCAIDAKLAPHISWIPRAVEKGAKLFKFAKAQLITHAGGRATGVQASWKPDGRRGEKQRLIIEAPVVVVAGGTLASPALIARSGLSPASDQLGRNFQLHPGVAVGASFDEDIDCWHATPQPYYSDQFLDEGMILLVGAIPPPLGALVVSGGPREHKRWMGRYRGFADAGALIHDSRPGRIRFTRKGRSIMTYNMTKHDARRLQKGIEETGKIFLAAGAKAVFPGYLGARAARDERELKLVLGDYGKTVPRHRLLGGSVHPMGTCRMGPRPQDAVVDNRGELHGCKGVYVPDGAILPTSTVVNPQQAIMTLATHVAWSIRDGE